jgi:hypothetical protein
LTLSDTFFNLNKLKFSFGFLPDFSMFFHYLPENNQLKITILPLQVRRRKKKKELKRISKKKKNRRKK